MCSILDLSQCMVFRRSTFSVVRSGELQKQQLLVRTPSEHCLQRPLHPLKSLPGLPLPSMASFRFEDDIEHCVTINTDSRCLVSSGQHLIDGKGRQGHQWFQQDEDPTHFKIIIGIVKPGFFWPTESGKCDLQSSPYSSELNPSTFLSLGIF